MNFVVAYIYRYDYYDSGERTPAETTDYRQFIQPTPGRGQKHEFLQIVTEEQWEVYIDQERQPQLEIDGGAKFEAVGGSGTPCG